MARWTAGKALPPVKKDSIFKDIAFVAAFLLTATVCRAEDAVIDSLVGRIQVERIGQSAGKTLQKYLADEYRRDCAAAVRKKADRCQRVRPAYTGATLPRAPGIHPLPREVMDRIGYTPPGAAYLQHGYTVYLVRILNRRVYDHVSVWD